MKRRTFLTSLGAAGLAPAVGTLAAQSPEPSAPTKVSAGSAPGAHARAGEPVVTGPAPDALAILQPLRAHATGFVEYALDDGPFRRVDAETAGLLPFEEHALKFRLPPLPPGRTVRYRVTTRSIGWVPVREFVHGRIVSGDAMTGPERAFRTLDPDAETTRFVVWNDTHENQDTLVHLQSMTAEIRPDFLLWNGDQTNDIHDPADMNRQFLLLPEGHPLAAQWPLAYVRGNHDVRGPAARHLPAFTGTPEDRFYYAFRSGPLAALVMDTGEDKPDDHPNFAGLASFQAMRERQAAWLAHVVREPWFRNAPFRVLFCHLPLWWIRDRKDIGWWEFSPVCRDAWAPTLAAAGVQVVISGHTHGHAWMPAGPDQPVAQLVGGGPHPSHATLIRGTATNDTLHLQVLKLDGSVPHDIMLRA